MNSLDTSHVTCKEAFLGTLTTRIRNKAGELAEGCAGRILDVGCGNGLFFAALQVSDEAKLFGADWSMALLREAQQIFLDNKISGTRLVRTDMYHLPFKSHTLDMVFLLNTLLNISTHDKAMTLLQELMALCSPGGRIVFDIRNKANPYIRMKYWWHRRKQTFPTYAYDLKDICSLLERNGFAPTRVLPIGISLKHTILAYLIEAQRRA